MGHGRGIIPACAGSTSQADSSGTASRDHPRMCGEHTPFAAAAEAIPGSSPHVRGAHHRRGEFVFAWGIIPACAGSTRAVAGTTVR